MQTFEEVAESFDLMGRALLATLQGSEMDTVVKHKIEHTLAEWGNKVLSPIFPTVDFDFIDASSEEARKWKFTATVNRFNREAKHYRLDVSS